MAKKILDRETLNRNEDWYGNNAAVRCPLCGKVFIISGFLNKGQRECPICHRSSAEITKDNVTISWPDDIEIAMVWTREELMAHNRLDEFISLVKEGGAIDPRSIEAKLPKAQKIAFIERNGQFVAIAAKKRADAGYAQSVTDDSGYHLRSDIPELGYVEVSKACRGQGLSIQVVRRILFEFGESTVFATTGNDKMKPVLAQCGFRWVGHEWKSIRPGEMLSLWIRNGSE